MVKADVSRDYYGDLELQPSCDANDIKKQFKKLALAYHPDRNPGRENEVTAKFQRIQSAHEVLLDPTERAKYDGNRTKNVYASYNGRASGMRGNPWSNVSSQYPPPPKPPARAPPPSAGAQRYGKFETPRSGGTAKEGASARTDTFKAWESMRGQARPKTSDRPEPPKRPAAAGRPFVSPKTNDPPKSTRAKEEGVKFAVPPRPRPSEPFTTSTPKRDASIKGFKGFKPTAPGDEQPAPRGAYFTERSHPPEPPPRTRPESYDDATYIHPSKRANVTADILEGRTSTPYSMHGGERFNPFAANLNRSKSQRVQSDMEKPIPRTESDPNMNAPRNHRPPHRTHQYSFPNIVDDETSSSDESIGISIPSIRRNKPFANERRPAAAEAWSSTSDPQKVFAERPLNASDYATPKPKGAENMYAAFAETPISFPTTTFNFAKPTVSNANQKANPSNFSATSTGNGTKYPNFFKPDFLAPSGVPVGGSDTEDEWFAKNRPQPSKLNPIETTMRDLVDHLVLRKNDSAQRTSQLQSNRSSSTAESPSKKPRLGTKMTPCTCHGRIVFSNLDDEHVCGANKFATSFSMNIDSETFSNTRPPNLTSRSTDSINTKFTPEDWHGQFTAGDYFRPDQNVMGGTRPRRAQSGSRTRGRSPIKVRYVDPQLRTVPQEHEISMTPGGTKFSAEEWQETFKTQTFAPPAMPPKVPRKPKGPTVRPTMGTAAVVEDGSSDDTKPLFGKKPPTPASSPDAMDIDTPNPTTPTFTAPPSNASLHVNTAQTPKRPAPTPSGTEEELKVHMEDLAVKDVLSTHDLPKPPRGPILPHALSTSTTATPLTATSPIDQQAQPIFHSRPPSATSASTAKVLKDSYIQAFTSYMAEWDLFSNRMMLHLVARKNQSDALANHRWDDVHLIRYRHGVKVDKAVLGHWNECLEKHAGVLRDWAVFREREKREAVVAAQVAAGVTSVQAGVAGLGIGVGKDGDYGNATASHVHVDRERPQRKRTH